MSAWEFDINSNVSVVRIYDKWLPTPIVVAIAKIVNRLKIKS